MSSVAELHQAIKEDDVKNVGNLVQSGTDVNCIYQQETAFTRALDLDHTRSAEIIFVAPKFDPNAKNQFDRTPLFIAAKKGYADFVERLLDFGAAVDTPDVRGVTPLGACAWYDSHASAEILLKHGANVNRVDAMGQTPLLRACSNVSKAVAGILLKHNCDVNIPSKDGKSPLMEALPNYYSYQVTGKKISDMLDISRMLVEAGCDVDFQDSRGKTALHQAVEASDQAGLCLLAESGAHLDVKDKEGYTPFQSAILPTRPHYDMARLLLYYGTDARQKMPNPGVEHHDSASVQPLSLVLNSKPKPNDLETQWSRSLLLRSLWAAVYPKDGSRAGLLNNNEAKEGDPDTMSFHERIERDIVAWLHECTPCSLQHQSRLAIRAQFPPKNILPKIRLLPIGSHLQQYTSLGLDVGKIPLSKICQLHCHIFDGDRTKVREYVESGVDVNFPINNKTAIALALEKGDSEIISILMPSVKHRVNETIVNADGDSILHVAAKHGRLSIVDAVISSISDIDRKNSVGYTPLQEAVIAGHFDIAARLIQLGADITMSSNGEHPPLPILHIAAASGAMDVVEMLLMQGINPNTVDQFGNTALHVAASKGAEYLRRFISLPALYSSPCAAHVDTARMILTGGSPILTLRHTGHAQVVQLLVRAGADVSRENQDGKTPTSCAREIRAADVEEVLGMGAKAQE